MGVKDKTNGTFAIICAVVVRGTVGKVTDNNSALRCLREMIFWLWYSLMLLSVVT